MTPKEKKLIIDFLEEYYEELSGHGCNDWEFPSDWTKKEKRQFVKEFHEFNRSPDEFDEENLILGDFCALSLLISKLSKEI
jgi:hypothetical protein